VAVPVALRLAGLIAPQAMPDGVVSVKPTAPAKWLRKVIVMVDVADVSMTTAAGEVAAMLKSRTWKVAVVVWTSLPLLPVIVSV
jgi:hypothetical protein